MSYDLLLDERVSRPRRPLTAKDSRNNAIADPDAAPIVDSFSARFEQIDAITLGASEDLTSRDTRVAVFRVFLESAAADTTALDTFVRESDGETYEILGDPVVRGGRAGEVRTVETRCRRIRG
jgi:hypothetical protein